jgi:hypothetical protein
MSDEHALHYAGPSTLTSTPSSSSLQLVTEALADSPPCFFQGRLLQPRLSADLLTAVSLVVSSRFFVPPNAKARQFTDPVVTAGAGVLRFEGFSACASTWIRADFSPEAYSSSIVSHGPTSISTRQCARRWPAYATPMRWSWRSAPRA